MLRRAVLIILALLAPAAALAQPPAGRFEQITVSTIAVGIAQATMAGMNGCAVVTENQALRMRFDGTAPTSTIGTPIAAGGAWVFESLDEARVALFIRSGGSDATAWISCWSPGGQSLPIGASGGSGGGGGSVTQGTTPWLVAGQLSNNNAAPSTTNVGVLGALANASAPSWTEGRLTTLSVDLSGALRVSGAGGGTQYTNDAALTVATTVGTMAMGRSSAAAPTGVSADDDAVLPWYLRNGAQATVITAAGALVGGDATNGLDVDVTRVTGTVTVAGGKTNNNAAPGATNVGALIGIANASAPTWSEGFMVGASFDLSGALRVAGSTSFTQYTQDAALTVATTVGGMAMGRASAAAPTDVSADNDAVIPWYLRSGAVVSQPTFGGVLASVGNGGTGTGVLRVAQVSDGTGRLATLDTLTSLTGGGVASGAADSGNPVKVGGRYNSSAPTLTNGQRGDLQLTATGAVIVAPGLTGAFATDQTLDAAIGTTGPLMTGRGSTALPTAMSADNDTTAIWTTLNGAVNATLRDVAGATLSAVYDAAHPGSGLGIGFRVDTTTPSSMADGDLIQPWATITGALYGASDGFEDVASTADRPLSMIGNTRLDVAASSAGTSGDNAAFISDSLGLLWMRGWDPCQGATSRVVIDIVTATTTEIIDQSASNKAYICGLSLFTAGAGNVTIVEDGDNNCASPSGALFGGVTAAEGWNFIANQGIALPNAGHKQSETSATNLNVCIITSAGVQLSGTVIYALAP